MNCIFCHADSETAKITKEHLFSVPVCKALGIDRSMVVLSLDGNTGEVSNARRLDERQVRLPCTNCNSGWMSLLEVDVAKTFRRWISDPQSRLTNTGLDHLARWMAKTSIVLGFAEGNSRQFMKDPTGALVPDVSLARTLAQGDVPRIVLGGARAAKSDRVWGSGNASVDPVGPDRISSRAVNVLALNAAELQLWAVLPIVTPDELNLPVGVQVLTSNSTLRGLRYRSSDLDPAQVAAHYSDATTDEFNKLVGQ